MLAPRPEPVLPPLTPERVFDDFIKNYKALSKLALSSLQASFYPVVISGISYPLEGWLQTHTFNKKFKMSYIHAMFGTIHEHFPDKDFTNHCQNISGVNEGIIELSKINLYKRGRVQEVATIRTTYPVTEWRLPWMRDFKCYGG